MANGEWDPGTAEGLSRRTALVTGGNGGLGYQAALRLAVHGWRVLVGSRDAGRGAAAVAAIRALVPGASAGVVGVDLADLSSVRAAASGLVRDDVELDLLVNNAGVMAVPSRRLTAQGLELQIGTNHFGHFALTGLLMPLLLRRAGSRVVTVTSVAHRWGRLDLADLHCRRRYSPWRAYGASKLANAVFTVELGRRLALTGAGTLSIGAHPGIAATNLGTAGPTLGGRSLFAAPTAWGMRRVGQSPVAGCGPILRAATDPDAVGGSCYGPQGMAELRGEPGPVSFRRLACAERLGQGLWSESERLTGVTYPF
ncbi:oxidoreductase [Streptomyces sp. NPDC042898]|uniref:oxidoreductase n=1 Tax=Streptomyces sp. NPDC042898 TaxID=3154334 RepID=UPI00340D8BE7